VTETAVPPAAGAALAKRLRELRRSGFPGARLTQQQLARALSSDEPVADATLSNWENVRAPQLPPPRRLKAYARFFATERSLAGEPHLVPLDDLSPVEQQARQTLEQELFGLREQSAGRLSPRGKFWHFDDGAPVTIICSDLSKSDKLQLGPLSEEDNPNYAELYSYGDPDALFELYGHLRSTNPNTDVYLRRGTPTNLAHHMVVLGGIAWNDVTRRLNDMLHLPVKQVENKKIPSGEVFVTGGGANRGEEFLPRWLDGNPGTADKPGVLLEDVGMLARVPNPFNELRTLTYCNGIHSRGVLGAVQCLTNRDVRDDNERYLEKAFPGSDHFVILMRVRVLGARTVSPSLTSPGVVLFQWTDDPAAT
jgi:transcriptional regulator with XRE-family HTH domain